MKKIVFNLLLVVSIFAISCKSNHTPEVILSEVEVTHLNKLSSASGISVYNNVYYIIGDDTPWLYKLNTKLYIFDSIRVAQTDSLVNNRTPKKLKADFECADIILNENNVEIIIISSGSVIDIRDTAHIVRYETCSDIISRNIRPLYESIKFQAGLNSQNEINIEGIAVSDDHVYLLHRGNVSDNLIVRIVRNDFMDYIKGSIHIPDFDIFSFILPIYQGVSSGFSGACIDPDNLGLIFTASMEDTKDEINDGVVLGSFVGFIPFSGLDESVFYASLLTKDGIPLEKKLEGVSIISCIKKQMQLLTVCDNDDGTSDIIRVKMEIK